ncbi:MAG: Na(+)-translocating NADH-quinone reductase subunit A [Gammaproteobacteria bacterium]
MNYKISKGLNLSLEGEITNHILPVNKSSTNKVAILGRDYHGIKPTMFVSEGEKVSQGDKLFEDKKNPGFNFISPVNGKILEINRGDRRAFLSLVIEKSNEENTYEIDKDFEINSKNVANFLITSGCWNLFRTRPFSKVPEVNSTPKNIFISLIDSNPLAVNPEIIVKENFEAFNLGLKYLSVIPEKHIHLSQDSSSDLDLRDLEKLKIHKFSGIHPYGLVGTQINKISPVSLINQAWTIGYQEVITIGKILLSGYLSNEKYISLSGPQVFSPEILLTEYGSSISELTAGKIIEGDNRVISGSVLCGHSSEGAETYLSNFSNQISVIRESNKKDREFMNWIRPEIKKHSSLRMFFTSFLKNYKFNLSSSINGGFRAIVPVGIYEDVFPMNLMITQLLKAIVTEDTELAQNLGILELDEEDLAICTYSCPSKYDYGLILRSVLDKIEKDG